MQGGRLPVHRHRQRGRHQDEQEAGPQPLPVEPQIRLLEGE